MTAQKPDPGEGGGGVATEPALVPPRAAADSSLWRWRGPSSLVGGALFALLGLMLVLAGRAHGGDTALENARPADLVAILDSLEGDIDRLEAEKRLITSEIDALGSGTSQEALANARERLSDLEVLAGTTAVVGPGVQITITDPDRAVDASDILNAVQELRDAGAESIEFASRRVVVNTWFADPEEGEAGIVVSGDLRPSPYVIRAIGNPDTLATAMQIPGGVAETVRTAQAEFELETRDVLEIDSTVPLVIPEYAEPVTEK